MLPDEIYIEIFLFKATPYIYFKIQNKKLALRLLKESVQNSHSIYFQWSIRKNHSLKDVILSSLEDGNRLYNSAIREEQILVKLANIGAKKAAECAKLEDVLYFVIKGANKWDDIARCAAKGGNKRILDNIVARGVNDFQYIACGAAEGGHKEILNHIKTIAGRNYNFRENSLAHYARKSNNAELIREYRHCGKIEYLL